MSTFTETIEKMVTTLLPYILLSNVFPSYLIPILVLSPLLINASLKFILPYFEKKHEHSLTIYETSKWNQHNKFYANVSFVLEKHGLIDKLKKQQCDRHYWETNKMFITPDELETLEFKHNDFTVTIGLKEKQNEYIKTINKYYYIQGKTISDINLFKKYISNEIPEDMNKISETEDKYVCMTYVESEWIKKYINVNKTFDNIFLDKQMKNNIEKNIDEFLSNEKNYIKFGIPRKMGFIFYGIPGTGKSSTVFAISKKYNMRIYIIKIDCDKKIFLQQISDIKEKSILLFEDIDTLKLTHDRCDNNDEKTQDNKKTSGLDISTSEKITLGDILEILDGYYYLKECIVIMTTNNIDKLDAALIRPGRIDHRYEYKYLTKEIVFDIIKYFYDISLDMTTLHKMKCNNITSAKLINSIILPHMHDSNYVINYLLANETE